MKDLIAAVEAVAALLPFVFVVAWLGVDGLGALLLWTAIGAVYGRYAAKALKWHWRRTGRFVR